jgi:monomeric sarcosine oxidase
MLRVSESGEARSAKHEARGSKHDFMRIAIIGIGGTGSACARHLAKLGHDVLMLEQFTLDHDQGSSFGHSRIIRRTYPDLLYTRMMNQAYPLWEELERESGEPLFVKSGGVYFGREGHPDIDLVANALEQTKTPCESLGPREFNARFPGFRLLEGERAIFQADSGFLRASACVRAQVRLALEAGAHLVENCRVLEIEREVGLNVISERQGKRLEHAVDRVVVTAGPWIERLVPELAGKLHVTRQQYAYLRIARNADRFVPGRFPVWIDAGKASGGEMYGFPSDGRIEGIKFAAHIEGIAVDPDSVSRDVDETALGVLRAYAAQRMPDLSPEVAHAQTCLYTNTRDKDFVIGEQRGIVHVSGCSGHGFKFTVLLGQIAAKLALGENPGLDLSRFSAGRL